LGGGAAPAAPPIAISRGGRLWRRPSQPPRQGGLPVVSWIMARVRIWENSELVGCLWVFVFMVVASD
jgi:hypothetical protein